VQCYRCSCHLPAQYVLQRVFRETSNTLAALLTHSFSSQCDRNLVQQEARSRQWRACERQLDWWCGFPHHGQQAHHLDRLLVGHAFVSFPHPGHAHRRQPDSPSARFQFTPHVHQARHGEAFQRAGLCASDGWDVSPDIWHLCAHQLPAAPGYPGGYET